MHLTLRQTGYIIVAASCGLAIFLLPSVPAKEVVKDGHHSQYRISHLGALPGFPGSRATDLNDRGQVIGYTYVPTESSEETQAFIWQGGTVRPFGKRGERTEVVAINNSSQVIGAADRRSGGHYAFLWKNGKRHVIRPPSGYKLLVPTALNARGDIACNAYRSYSQRHDPRSARGFLYRNARLYDLGPGGVTTLNDRGQVLGWTYGPKNSVSYFLWEGGKKRAFAGPPAAAFNNRGHIISNNRSDSIPILVRAGKSSRLGQLPGYTYLHAKDLNDQDQVVGYGMEYQTGVVEGDYQLRTAFLWKAGKTYNLNALIPRHAGWDLIEASAINNRGQIVGSGIYQGNPRAFLLTPVK